METRLGPEAYALLLDAAPDGVLVVDPDGVIAYANRFVQLQFGYERAELIGSPIEMLVPDRARAAHSGHRTVFIESPRRRPMGSGLDLVALRKDGSEFPVEISLSPLESQVGLLVMATVRDVTARRRMEQALRASEERYRLLAENAVDIIYRLSLADGRARVDYISPSVSITGHTPNQFYADPALIETITHPDDRPLLHDSLAAPAAQREPLTLRVIDAHGGIIWTEHRLRPVFAVDGTVSGVEGIARDITERVRVEEERRLLLADSEMQRERERIAADLHDGVMQSIYGVGLSLRHLGAEIGDAQPAVRDHIAEAIQELSNTISDIRRYVMDLRPVRFTGDLGESVADAARLFEHASQIPTSVEIELDDAETDDDSALAVFHVVREALSNVRRHAQASAVTISLHRSDDEVVLSVCDDGVGFDAEATGPDGHFGLQNMQLRARSSGGRLRIVSAPGQGTVVEMSVPLIGTHPVPDGR